MEEMDVLMWQSKKWQLMVLSLSTIFITIGCSGTGQGAKQAPEASAASEAKIPAPAKIQQLAAIGDSSKVYFIDAKSVLKDTLINKQKGIRISGDLFFSLHSKQTPIYLQTSLVSIEVLETPAWFRVDAYDADEGQAIEVLGGTLRIAKAYSSPFPEPDTLHANDLYMINKGIDLSEKETLDNDLLQKWWEKYGEKE